MKIRTLLTIAAATALFTGCMADKEPVHAKTHTAHWSYEGENGPKHWGHVSATCAEGQKQSPINIVSSDTKALSAEHVLAFHESTQAQISHEIDNGHAIKISPKGEGGISVNGEHYKLLQFHFHGNSENTLDGKHFAMEMHLVHQNSKGQLAVVSVMIKEGAHDKALEGVLAHLNGGDLEVAMDEILPKDKSHYFYFSGSLTTPPCSEDVKWFVLKDTISVDAQQLAAFRSHHKDNFRPVQPLNGRIVEAN